MLNVDYFMMVEPITQMLLPLGSNIGDQNYPLSNCHLDSFGVFFDKLVYPLTAFVKFGFSEKATKFEKKIVAFSEYSNFICFNRIHFVIIKVIKHKSCFFINIKQIFETL